MTLSITKWWHNSSFYFGSTVNSTTVDCCVFLKHHSFVTTYLRNVSVNDRLNVNIVQSLHRNKNSRRTINLNLREGYAQFYLPTGQSVVKELLTLQQKAVCIIVTYTDLRILLLQVIVCRFLHKDMQVHHYNIKLIQELKHRGLRERRIYV